MPFINGRYHINPAMGHALEDARSAAEELLASDDPSHSSRDDDFTADRADSSDDRGPIHHIEIEAAETVPAHSGRAAHGFIARIHRVSGRATRDSSVEARGFPALSEVEGSPARNDGREAPTDLPGSTSRRPGSPALLPQAVAEAAPQRQSLPLRPETHVFTDHRDLLDFLRSEFARDGSR